MGLWTLRGFKIALQKGYVEFTISLQLEKDRSIYFFNPILLNHEAWGSSSWELYSTKNSQPYVLVENLTEFNSQAKGQNSLRQVIIYDYNNKSNSHRSSKMLQCVEVKWSESHSVGSNSVEPRRLYSQWNSPGQNTGVGSLSLLQGIFSTQGLNPGLPHRRRILYQLSSRGWFLLKAEFQKLFRVLSGHGRVGER